MHMNNWGQYELKEIPHIKKNKLLSINDHPQQPWPWSRNWSANTPATPFINVNWFEHRHKLSHGRLNEILIDSRRSLLPAIETLYVFLAWLQIYNSNYCVVYRILPYCHRYVKTLSHNIDSSIYIYTYNHHIIIIYLSNVLLWWWHTPVTRIIALYSYKL